MCSIDSKNRGLGLMQDRYWKASLYDIISFQVITATWKLLGFVSIYPIFVVC